MQNKGEIDLININGSVDMAQFVGPTNLVPSYYGNGLSPKPNDLRPILYNGQGANSPQLNGAFDAVYVTFREASVQVRESGFAKENAAGILRRGVIVDAQPGQAAVDDNRGLHTVSKCEGGLNGASLDCI